MERTDNNDIRINAESHKFGKYKKHTHKATALGECAVTMTCICVHVYICVSKEKLWNTTLTSNSFTINLLLFSGAEDCPTYMDFITYTCSAVEKQLLSETYT